MILWIIAWFVCGVIAAPVERRICFKANRYVDKWETPIAIALGPITLICVAIALIQDYNADK
jgi:hypothetical protein